MGVERIPRSRRHRVLLCLIACNLLSCASGPEPVSEEELQAHLQQQRAWLEGLQAGMPVEQALSGANSYRYYQFEIKQDQSIYQYIQGRGAVTQTLYGLYFENTRLVSLLLNQDVTAADSCYFHLYKRADAWPVVGFGETDAWIRTSSQLGGHFDAVSGIDPGLDPEADSGAARAVEAVTHGALAVVLAPVALPFLAISPGGDDRHEKRAKAVELGLTTGDALLELFGRPTYVRKESWGENWTYTADDASYGLVNGIVAWRESGWWGTPRNDRTRRVSCPGAATDQ